MKKYLWLAWLGPIGAIIMIVRSYDQPTTPIRVFATHAVADAAQTFHFSTETLTVENGEGKVTGYDDFTFSIPPHIGDATAIGFVWREAPHGDVTFGGYKPPVSPKPVLLIEWRGGKRTILHPK